MNIKKKVLISGVSILAILAILYSYHYFNKIKPYNDALSNANQAVVAEEYDKAIASYAEALKYKEDVNISKKIDTAKLLKKSKESYDSADKQMMDKKYLEAIDSFKKVDNQDNKIYSTAQNKIKECTKLYIADNLKTANDSLKTNKFEEASKYIDNILKIDVANTDAKKLKNEIVAKQKEKGEAEHKKQEDEKKKLNSVGIFVSQYTLLYRDSVGKPNENLSSFVITLSNISGNEAKITYFTSSKGGSVTGAEGIAEYQENGEWHFKLKSDNRGSYMIGTFLVNGGNATFNEIGTTGIDAENQLSKLDLKDLKKENAETLIRCDDFYKN